MQLELVIILLVLSSCLTIAYLQTRNSIDDLIPEIESISKYIQEFRSRYETLNEENALQSFEYDALHAEYEQLQLLYSVLEQNYTSILFGNTSTFQVEYDTLLDQYITLNETFTDLNLEYFQLTASFIRLNGNFSQFQQDYSTVVDQINRHTESSWPHGAELINPNDPLVEALVYNITGVYVNVDDGNNLWDDIYQLYDWVYQNIQYQNDGYYPALPLNVSSDATVTMDMWQFPNQTISEKQGDCEDKAILLCSLLRSYSNRTMLVECMRVKEHVLCYIPVSDAQICILDPTLGYYTQTDPPWNRQITYKDVQNEMNVYLSWSGTEPVYYIFSDYIEKQFANTQEFIDWMNDRT